MSLTNKALDHVLAFNGNLTEIVSNGYDWLFRRDKLVKSGHTWFELVLDTDLMNVRHYALPDEQRITFEDDSEMPINRDSYDIPLILVPPLGVTSDTFDLLPGRSIVRYYAAKGFKTYLIDWGSPTRKHAHLDMEAYANTMMTQAIEAVRKHSGAKDVSLMGWCMGGLLCLIHQGLTQDPHVRNIVTIASPVDMRGAGMVASVANTLHRPAKMIQKLTRRRLDDLNPKFLAPPGWMVALGFKMTAPLKSITTYWDLVTNLWDRNFVEIHSTTANYLNKMMLYPGGVIQDMVVKVAFQNRLAKGQLQVGDAVADLTKIECPLLVFAGDKDHLVSPSAAQGVLSVVGSADKTMHVAPGGHMSVILGSKARIHVWAPTADWLASRSAQTRTSPATASKTRSPRKKAAKETPKAA